MFLVIDRGRMLISKKREQNPTRKAQEAKRRRLLKAASLQAARGFPITAGGMVGGASRRTGGWSSPQAGSELKFLDYSGTMAPGFGTQTFTTPGLLLNGCAPGSSAETRIGRKITMKSIYIRYSYSRSAATMTGGSPGRILIVYDKQSNAAAPAITDILLADDYHSMNNLSNRDRFITLFDSVTEPISDTNNVCVGDTLYKGMNLDVMFNGGNAGTIGDITSGAIYAFAATTNRIGVSNPQVVFRSRIRYTDA